METRRACASENRVAKEDYSTCGSMEAKECINDCVEPICYVRDLREAVSGTGWIESMVEMALEEHWFTAYNAGIKSWPTVQG